LIDSSRSCLRAREFAQFRESLFRHVKYSGKLDEDERGAALREAFEDGIDSELLNPFKGSTEDVSRWLKDRKGLSCAALPVIDLFASIVCSMKYARSPNITPKERIVYEKFFARCDKVFNRFKNCECTGKSHKKWNVLCPFLSRDGGASGVYSGGGGGGAGGAGPAVAASGRGGGGVHASAKRYGDNSGPHGTTAKKAKQ
jgi:hypothetical protein